MVQETQRAIEEAVDRAGHKAQFIISGSGDYQYMDVLSIHGGKRNAMEYVRGIFGISPSRVVAAGDSGNDILMLEGDFPCTAGKTSVGCPARLVQDSGTRQVDNAMLLTTQPQEPVLVVVSGAMLCRRGEPRDCCWERPEGAARLDCETGAKWPHCAC
jgi:hypothetical protein